MTDLGVTAFTVTLADKTKATRDFILPGDDFKSEGLRMTWFIQLEAFTTFCSCGRVFNLDIRIGYPLGTVFAYGRDEELKGYSYRNGDG